MTDIQLEKYQTKEYTGTIESMKELIKNLNLEIYEYFIDVINDRFIDKKHGVLYKVGDYYHYPLPNDET